MNDKQILSQPYCCGELITRCNWTLQCWSEENKLSQCRSNIRPRAKMITRSKARAMKARGDTKAVKETPTHTPARQPSSRILNRNQQAHRSAQDLNSRVDQSQDQHFEMKAILLAALNQSAADHDENVFAEARAGQHTIDEAVFDPATLEQLAIVAAHPDAAAYILQNRRTVSPDRGHGVSSKRRGPTEDLIDLLLRRRRAVQYLARNLAWYCCSCSVHRLVTSVQCHVCTSIRNSLVVGRKSQSTKGAVDNIVEEHGIKA